MSLPTFQNTNRKLYDCTVGNVGLNFLIDPNTNNTYQTASYRTQQIDTGDAPGEQSLGDLWWRRSQNSFHYGSGSKVLNLTVDKTLEYRYQDSHNVDVFQDDGLGGAVTLLHKVTKAQSTTENRTKLIGFNTNGFGDGVLWARGDQLSFHDASGSPHGLLNSFGSENVRDIGGNGGRWFLATTQGIWAGNFPTSFSDNPTMNKYYSYASASTAVVEWAKDRLFAGINNSLYELVPSGASAVSLPAPLFTHKESSWVWTDIVDAPAKVYASGYVGNQGGIYAIGLTNTATLQTPTLVAPLPKGEVPLSMVCVAGTYVVVGTNKTIRIYYIDGNGLLQGGYKVVPKTDMPVYALADWENYVFAGGAVSDGFEALYKINLDANVDPNNQLAAPWSKHIVSDQVPATSKYVQGLALIGYSDQLAFSITNTGLYVEDPVLYAAQGWLLTSQINDSVSKPKLFQNLDVVNAPTGGVGLGGYIKVEWVDEIGGVQAPALMTYDAGAVKENIARGADGVAHTSLAYKFTLQASLDKTHTPVLKQYTSEALPVNFFSTTITLAINIMPEYRPNRNPAQTLREGTYAILEELNRLRQLHLPVVFENLNTGETRTGIITNSKFQQTVLASNDPFLMANPAGQLQLELTTIDDFERYNAG